MSIRTLKINDKYDVIIGSAGPGDWTFKAYRRGEEWRDLAGGDNLLLAMAYRIEELEDELIKIREEQNK